MVFFLSALALSEKITQRGFYTK